MSVLESRYRSNLNVEEGKNLVADAIEAQCEQDFAASTPTLIVCGTFFIMY